MSDCAFLNNSGNFTSFTYAGRTIRFRTPSSLERYTDILEWDKGYLVVMAKYKGAPAEEEYSMPDILSIADHADMIVNGYAFSKSNDSVRVLNLNNPASACVLSADGKILETTMDDIELDIVQDYYSRNRKHLEES